MVDKDGDEGSESTKLNASDRVENWLELRVGDLGSAAGGFLGEDEGESDEVVVPVVGDLRRRRRLRSKALLALLI